jgi:hypothetical protein
MAKDGLTIGVIGTGRSVMQKLGVPEQAVAIKDPITAPPVLSGAAGKAWLTDLTAGAPEEHGVLASWIVEAPGAHPLWHSYSVVLVHLRPMADGRKTLFYLPDATHEIWVYALNPEADRNVMLMRAGNIAIGLLHPGNYIGQFIEISDDLAIERVRATVQEICDGKLSPDTDHVNCCWVKRYGDYLLKDRPGGPIKAVER